MTITTATTASFPLLTSDLEAPSPISPAAAAYELWTAAEADMDAACTASQLIPDEDLDALQAQADEAWATYARLCQA